MKWFGCFVTIACSLFLFFGCMAKTHYYIQANETIEDTEFMGMYGTEYLNELPETGIVIINRMDKNISFKIEGNIVKTIKVSAGETSSTALLPGSYTYSISVSDSSQNQSTPFSSKIQKKAPAIKALTGEKVVRERCRTTFNVFLEQRVEE